jgi:hypothetical protein
MPLGGRHWLFHDGFCHALAHLGGDDPGHDP